MASLNRWKFPTENMAAKLLSLVIALVFWLTVAADKETQRNYAVPVNLINVPPGVAISGNVPKKINLSISGPEILFLTHDLNKLLITLDLQKTGEGTVSFPEMQKCVDLPSGMKVLRVYPSGVQLKMVRKVN